MCLNSTCVLRKLIRNFYEKDMSFHLTPEEIAQFTWEVQNKFLLSTINSARLKQYPPSVDFLRLFFKKLINQLENNQEVHDDFYTSLCSVVQNNGKCNLYYSHYLIDEDFENVTVIKETKNMVINGTTGMKTWEAALMLSDWAVSNKEVFSGKSILELGSGVGLTGITIAKMCNIQSIHLTDCHQLVLDTLKENVEINFPSLTRVESDEKTSFCGSDLNIDVEALDWNHLDNIDKDIVPDIIIGADIVYDPSIMQPLCNVFKHFKKKNSNVQIYIQSVIRNSNTFDGFVQLLTESNMATRTLVQDASVHMKWDRTTQRCLLLIT